MKKITFLTFTLLFAVFGFSQTFPGTGTPVDTQNGQAGTLATCGTAFELNLTVDVTGVGVLGPALGLDQIDRDITHTWSGDIQITLIAPDGTTSIDVTSGNGGGGDDYQGTQFRDDASTPITAGAAPFNGVFNPEEPLNTFNGVDADGTWTLNFCDSAGGDTGTFNSWSINFAPPPACFNPSNLGGSVTSTSTADLSWTAGGSEGLWDVEVVDVTGGGTVTGTPTATGVSNPYMATGLTEGNDYEFYVRADCEADGTSDWVGPFTWTQNVPPPNDLPGGAIPITPSPEGTGCASATFTLPFSTDFTTDSGAQGGCSDSGLDQFFTWTATTDGLTFNSGAPGNPGIVVWDAATLTEIDCADTFSTDTQLGGWTIGQNLVIQIYDFAGSVSDVAFCLEEFTFPLAPNCAETPISPLDGAVDVVLTGGDQVTLTWTAPSSGPAPTDYQIFFGDNSGALLDLGNLGSADTTVDITGLDYSTTYYWQIVPLNGASQATGCAEWSFTTEATPPPPSNDDCANATAVSAPSTTAFETFTATDDGPTANCGTTPGGPNVWFVYTATGAGDLLVSTCSDADFDTKINVYSGDCSNLVCEGGNDDGPGCTGFTSELTLPGLPAGDYYIAVSGFSGATGTGNLTLDFTLSDGSSLEQPNSLSYYPNPVKNTLTLNAQNTIDNVVMYNMLGQEVLKAAPNAMNSDIDMSNLQNGTYFVKVFIGDSTKTIRVIKH